MMDNIPQYSRYQYRNTVTSADTQMISPLPENEIHLRIKDEPIIVMNDKGFSYKGQLIEDAGEVYRLFKQFLIDSNKTR